MDKELEHRLTDVENRSKANQHRLDDVERRQDDLDKLVTSVGILAEREKRVEADVTEIKQDVKTLTAKPGQRWERTLEKIIELFLAAVIGFVAAKIFS